MMKDAKDRARTLLLEFKGKRYTFGLGCFHRLGGLTSRLGCRAAVVTSGTNRPWGPALHTQTTDSLLAAGVRLAGELVPGARPNTPVEDVLRIAEALLERSPDVVVAVGGGSVIDATKAAIARVALAAKYPDLNSYFGVDKITAMLRDARTQMLPMVAVQLASGSAAHLTKYSNITDLATAQKKLIGDNAIVPPQALFDYGMTVTMSKAFTSDGALDGVGHALEVYYGAQGDALAKSRPVSLLAIELIVNSVRTACDNPSDLAAREALGLGTDLGGYAIMIGGTNGAHLTSFSLVDIMPHGRACALMNPYYTIFFAPAIEPQLRDVAAVLARAGYLKTATDGLYGRDLGLGVAEGLIELSRTIGFPTKLAEVDGFTDAHIAKALQAAKNPQLASKLQNMPVALSAETVDDYMGPVLEAAKTGDFALIRNMKTSACVRIN